MSKDTKGPIFESQNRLKFTMPDGDKPGRIL